MSTIDRNDVFGVTHAPGSSVRLPVDLQLVEPRPCLAQLRLGEIELRLSRLVPRLGVIERLPGNQLPLEEVLRAIQVRLRETKIRLALTNRRRRDFVRRLGLLHLFRDFVVVEFREALTAVDAIAQAHRDVLETALHLRRGIDRRGADQVADHRDLLGHLAALHGAELHGHREARPTAAALLEVVESASAAALIGAATPAAATTAAAGGLVGACRLGIDRRPVRVIAAPGDEDDRNHCKRLFHDVESVRAANGESPVFSGPAP
jgi:hypothetical protein